MTISPKGFTQIAETDPPDGPAQINNAELFVENLIGESVSTRSALPASGNWVGRAIYVDDEDLVYICKALPGTWGVAAGDTGWQAATFPNGFISFDESSNKVKWRVKYGIVYWTGLVKRTTASAIGAAQVAVVDVPTAAAPSTNRRFACFAPKTMFTGTDPFVTVPVTVDPTSLRLVKEVNDATGAYVALDGVQYPLV